MKGPREEQGRQTCWTSEEERKREREGGREKDRKLIYSGRNINFHKMIRNKRERES